MPRTMARIATRAMAPMRINCFGSGFLSAAGFAAGGTTDLVSDFGAAAGFGSDAAGAGLGLVFEFGSIKNSLISAFIIAKKYFSLTLSVCSVEVNGVTYIYKG